MKRDTNASLPEDSRSPDLTESLTSKTFTSVSWTALGRMSQQVLSIVITAMLSRLLLPEAFGLIAMLMVFIGFANVFADSGLGSALVQRKSISPRQISTAFTLNVGIGIILTILFALGAPILANFYESPELEPLSRVFALSFLVSSVGIVPTSLMKRDLQFQLLAKVDIIAGVISGVLAISVALLGGGVWSLVALNLSQQATRTILVLYLSDWKPTLGFHCKEARQLIGFSAGLLGFNSINYWSRNADQLLIGRMLGASALGLYSRAYQLMMLPLSQVNSILSTVMFPIFSSIQDQPHRIASAYSRALGMVSLLAFPTTIGMFLVADPLIPLVYGSDWSGAIQVFRILCWVSLVQVLANPTGWIFTSMGKTRIMFFWSIYSTPVIIAGVAIGASFGSIESVAWGYLIANSVLFIPLYTIIGRIIDVRWRDIAKSTYRQFVAAIVMAAGVSLVGWMISDLFGVLVSMVIKIVAGIGIYLVMVIALRSHAYFDLYQIVSTRLGTRSDMWIWRIFAPRSSH